MVKKTRKSQNVRLEIMVTVLKIDEATILKVYVNFILLSRTGYPSSISINCAIENIIKGLQDFQRDFPCIPFENAACRATDAYLFKSLSDPPP